MKVNLLVEFNKVKYNPSYKSHIYKIKTMTTKLMNNLTKYVTST